MKVVAIIPARGGSKRLPKKNIVEVGGKPMIMWAIEAALGSEYISKENLYVTTEDDEVKMVVGNHCGIIDRPERLAADNVWTQPVIDHAVDGMELGDEDLIVILQANSPQITSKVIDECIKMSIENSLWQVHTVDEDMVNNGAVHVLRKKVSNHIGKANYNGVVKTNWVDIHFKEDIEKAEELM